GARNSKSPATANTASASTVIPTMSSHHYHHSATPSTSSAADSVAMVTASSSGGGGGGNGGSGSDAIGKRLGHAKKASEVSVVSGRTVYTDSDSDDELSYAQAMAAVGAGRAQQQQMQQQQHQQQKQEHHGKQKKRKSPSSGWDILTSIGPAAPGSGAAGGASSGAGTSGNAAASGASATAASGPAGRAGGVGDASAAGALRAPAKCEGYLFKRRRFPLKGWHKRWYVCDKGFFYYAKSANEMKTLGRYHGNIDLGNSFISYKRSRRRIHIDAGSIVHHVRCKRNEDFEMWIGQLNCHRTYRHLQLQNQPPSGTGNPQFAAAGVASPLPVQLLPPAIVAAISGGGGGGGRGGSSGGAGNDLPDAPVVPMSPAESVKLKSLTIARTGSLTRGMPPGSLSAATLRRLRDTTGVAAASAAAAAAAADDAVAGKLQKLRGLVTDIEAMLESCSKFCDSGKGKAGSSSGGGGSGSVAIRESSSSASGLGVGSGGGLQQSSSNPNLQELSVSSSSAAKAKQRHSALDVPVGGGGGGAFEAKDLADTLAVFLMKANSAAELIRQAGLDLAGERRRILTAQSTAAAASAAAAAADSGDSSGGSASGSAAAAAAAAAMVTAEDVAQLTAQVTELSRQNQDLRQRLSLIHGHSDLSAMIVSAVPQALLPDSANISSSLSRDSITEYHDAAERLSLDMSSSESEDELSDEDDANPPAADASNQASSSTVAAASGSADASPGGAANDASTTGASAAGLEVATTGRREVLPVPQPDGGNLSLFNILCRNIGKDLTSVRMPIASNEPLNALQRLCEELEYSSLLDQAAAAKDPLERLVLVVAFAVSAYACTATRSAKKPFNPLLGETYECVREDRGWKFISEQVSHHPPVAACHCESDAWEFWQDCRLRNKFWGKSLEAQPLGAIRLRFKDSGELFQWNKVTTCIYNLFSSSRYIDHYGELTVQGPVQGSQARLTFHKGGSISGVCRTGSNGPETAVFGRWNESLFAGREHTARCVWRSGALPPHSASYYGFTRFAIELNELQDCLVSVLPVTDTRFRPDQRLLEVGDLDNAEAQKLRLENKQRSRQTPVQPRWFRQLSSDKSWEFRREYWSARESKFAGIDLPDLFD
ncbi:hypothetical protein BOX15_Mlig014868g1, partial [Macrostomum lignano]